MFKFYLRGLTLALALFCLALCFDEWPDEREDAIDWDDGYIVEFHDDVSHGNARETIDQHDYDVEQQHRAFGKVFKIKPKRRRRRGADDLKIEKHPNVKHFSRLEVLHREKRELFDQYFDGDAKISHNKDRDFLYEKHDLSEFFRIPFEKKEDNFCSLATFDDPLYLDQWQIVRFFLFAS